MYLLKDASGTILAAHTNNEPIRLAFFNSAEPNVEIWIMDVDDTTGAVTYEFLFLSQSEPNRRILR